MIVPRAWLLLGSSILACGYAVSASAQETDSRPAASGDLAKGREETKPDAGQTTEIVVQAQRREERLQDVPVAVTAVTADTLDKVNIESSVDLRLVAPSLNSTPASGYVANSIRGVGSLGFAPGIESPVGLYIDGVYIAAPQASELSLNSVQSVEVLKGPQGTLFGRNATGGLIHIITRTPTQDFQGEVSASYGSFDTLVGRAYVSGGIADDLAADIAVTARTRDGFGTNVVDGADVGKIYHDVSVRSKWVWTPGPDTTVTAAGSYWDGRDRNGWFVEVPGNKNGFIPGRTAIDRGWDASTNLDALQDGWSAFGSFKVEQDFGDVRFQSISAYRSSILDLDRDLDYAELDVVALDLHQEDRQFSQEFQLSSKGTSRLRWTAGLYYFFLHSEYSPIVVDLRNFPAAGILFTANEAQESHSYAGYGQASYEIVDNTTLTLGGRYTSEKRSAIDASQVIDVPAFGLSIPAAFPDRSIKADRFTYRVSLDHRFSDQVLAYVSYNTGFKSGGFNTGAPGEPGYEPEKIAAYEVGVKSDLFDRRLRLNLAGFYYDYNNIQVQRIALASLVVFNGAKARIYGIDGDFELVLTDNLRLTGGFNWLDTKFTDFPSCPISVPGGGVPLVTGSCAGNDIPFAAKFSGSIAASYEHELGSGKLQLAGNVYYNSGYYFETDNVLRQPDYAKLGASATWTSDGGLSFGVYGRNLTNKRTAILEGSQTSGNTSVGWADPREVGVTIGYKF